jgi:hypothetical protein
MTSGTANSDIYHGRDRPTETWFTFKTNKDLFGSLKYEVSVNDVLVEHELLWFSDTVLISLTKVPVLGAHEMGPC